MPTFSKLSEEAIRKLKAGTEHPEYRDFVATLYRGDWAALTVLPGENPATVKRRLTKAAKAAGLKTRWRRGLYLIVEEGPERPAPQLPVSRNVPAPNRCPRCNGRMRFEREADGEEYVCNSCGHVQYPAGFVPMDKQQPEEGRRYREPSIGGMRL